VVRPRSCRVIYYFDTPALGRRHQSFGHVTYIIKEILLFTSYYFKSYLRTRINCIPRNDDCGELSLSENLSIYIIPDDKLIGKIYLIDIESRQAHNYMLFNYDELRPLV
jgi:hypothetical protein